jgi:predicted membrane-bound mannosyltransferase
LLAIYFAITAIAAAWLDHLATLPFALLFAIGFAYVGLSSLRRPARAEKGNGPPGSPASRFE